MRRQQFRSQLAETAQSLGKAGVDLSDGHTTLPEPVRRCGQFDSRPPDAICHCRRCYCDMRLTTVSRMLLICCPLPDPDPVFHERMIRAILHALYKKLAREASVGHRTGTTKTLGARAAAPPRFAAGQAPVMEITASCDDGAVTAGAVSGLLLASVLSLFGAFLVYFYAPFWSVRRVPGPPARFPIGHLHLLARNGPDVFRAIAKESGPIFR